MSDQNKQNQGQPQQHQYQQGNYSPADYEKVGPRSVEGSGGQPTAGTGGVGMSSPIFRRRRGGSCRRRRGSGE